MPINMLGGFMRTLWDEQPAQQPQGAAGGGASHQLSQASLPSMPIGGGGSGGADTSQGGISSGAALTARQDDAWRQMTASRMHQVSQMQQQMVHNQYSGLLQSNPSANTTMSFHTRPQPRFHQRSYLERHFVEILEMFSSELYKHGIVINSVGIDPQSLRIIEQEVTDRFRGQNAERFNTGLKVATAFGYVNITNGEVRTIFDMDKYLEVVDDTKRIP